jgi:hypothetical protein
MSSPSVSPPFTNIQVELLRLFAAQIPDDHLIELKKVIAQFLLDKARDKADAMWDERGFSAEKMEKLLGGQ